MDNFSGEKRLEDIHKFYSLLDVLEEKLQSTRVLSECDGKLDWPRRVVYFFFEPGEHRSTSGDGLRIVRVGTHGLKAGSKSTLWKRLRQHRGTMKGSYKGGGNHRGSIFRLHVGTALINRESRNDGATAWWGVGSSATSEIRQAEYPLELEVSMTIRLMPFLWLKIEDESGPESKRGYIERNSISLLSNFPYAGTGMEKSSCIDPPSVNWLGHSAASDRISRSGLWNSNHVDEAYDRSFLDALREYVDEI